MQSISWKEGLDLPKLLLVSCLMKKGAIKTGTSKSCTFFNISKIKKREIIQ